MSLVRTRAGTACVLVAALAGCGGGGSVLSPPPATVPHPASIPVPAAASAAATVHVGEAPSTTTLPSIGNVPMTVSFPSADGAADLTVTEETGAAVNTASADVRRRGRAAIGTLPQGPYLAAVDFSSPKTLTLRGTVGASFDVGPLLSADQKTALSFLLAIDPKLYIGVLDPAGGFTAIGPLAFNGTVVTASLPLNPITIAGGQTYRIGLHDGLLTSVPAPAAPSPSASPSVAPSASPSLAPSPSASPSLAPSPSASPSLAPSASPSANPSVAPSPSASATPPDNVAQNIDAAGHAQTDANAFQLPYAGGFYGSVGYPANNSNVVVAQTNAFNGTPQGAPSPPNETVDYAIKTILTAGPPANQTAVTIYGSNATIGGTLHIPFAPSTPTFTVYVYAPDIAGTNAIFHQQVTDTNGTIAFSSPFNTGSSISLPVPTTLYVEVAQP